MNLPLKGIAKAGDLLAMLDGDHLGDGSEDDGAVGAAEDGYMLEGHDQVDVGLEGRMRRNGCRGAEFDGV